MSIFSERVRWVRENLNMTQKEMATKVGLSQQGYSNIETGRTEPNLETLTKIRHILQEPLDFLVGYKFGDIRSDHLYELYAEARRRREEAEEDLQYTMEMLETVDQDEDIEKKMRLAKHHRDLIKEHKAKEERSFNSFYEYVVNIPGLSENFKEKQYWIDMYKSYQEDDQLLYKEFWEDYQNL